MRKINVGILADGGDAGGGRRHILTLCEKLPSPSLSIRFFSIGEGALSHSIEQLPTVPMETYSLSSKMDPHLPAKIRQWVLREKIDILHTHGLKANMYGRLALRKTKIPLVTTYHSNPLYDYSSRFMGIFFSLIDQITLSMTTSYIAVSYEVATQLIRRGVSRDSIHIVKNGVPLQQNPHLNSFEREEVRAQFGIPQDACVIGSLGRLVPVKGYDETLRVFKKILTLDQGNSSVAQADPKCTCQSGDKQSLNHPLYLLLIGGGEEESTLRTICARLGIQDRVIFAGFQKNPEPFILASDVMLFTPRSEALGIAILESMHAGRPVVSKKIGGIRELIINEYNGFICNEEKTLAESVLELLHSTEKRDAFTKNGQKMIQQYFSNETMIQKTQAVYRSLYADSVTICDVTVSGIEKETLLDSLQEHLLSPKGECKHIVTLNIEMLVKANRDPLLKKAIQEASLVVPDGTSIVQLADCQRQCRLTRIPGIELSTDILTMAHQNKKRVYFLGGKKSIQDPLYQKICTQYPGIQIAGMQDGYFKPDEEVTLVEEIRTLQVDILFVALGMGKQELFIQRWKESHLAKIAIGVGGSFDVWAGLVKRSPDWWINHRLEWLFRVIQQPKERFLRILRIVPAFTQLCHQKQKPKRIVLSGYYGFGNIGDEAILRSLMRDLKNLQTKGYSLCVSVFSANPYSTSTLTDAYAIERFSFLDVVKEIFRSDALVSGGGGLIQDITSFKSPLYYLGIIQIARLFRKPVLVYANGIGPLTGRWNRFLCKIVLNQTNSITVRDDASKELLQEIGVRNITVTVDPIFSLDPNPTHNIDSYPYYDNFIAICFGPNRKTKAKCKEIAAFLDTVAETTHLPLVFTPFYPHYDKQYSRLLQSQMKHPSHLINTFTTPEDMLSLLQRCRFGIGMRLHFMVLLSLLNKPILPFTYDPKVKTFADILKLHPVLTPEDSLPDMEAAFHSFYKATNQEPHYKEIVQQLREKNQQNFSALESFIASL